MNTDTEFRRSHNALRVLINLEMRDLEKAGVIEPGDTDDWNLFLANPFFYAISTPRAEKLWALIEKCQPASLKVPA